MEKLFWTHIDLIRSIKNNFSGYSIINTMVFKVMQRDFEEYGYKVAVYFCSFHKQGSSETDGTIRTEMNKEYSFTDIFKTDDAVADIRKFMKETFINKIPPEDNFWFKIMTPKSRFTIYDDTMYLLSDYFVEKAKEL